MVVGGFAGSELWRVALMGVGDVKSEMHGWELLERFWQEHLEIAGAMIPEGELEGKQEA